MKTKHAKSFKFDGYVGTVKNIPRSLNYRFNEYIIKSINENAFDQCSYKCIEFADDSEVEKFKKNIFQDSDIESLTIPSSLIELEEGWCNNAKCLKTIKISPNNQKYFLYQDTFILTKSDSEKEN